MEDQVETIAPHLEGKAHRWYLSRVAANPSAWTLTDFMDGLFNDSFQKDFKARLREKLHSNIQGSRKVAEYAHDVAMKLDTVGIISEKERVWYLWNGFQPQIESQLWLDRLSPETSTWDEIFDGAEAAEHAIKVLKRKGNRNGNDSYSRSDHTSRNQSNSQNDNRKSNNVNSRQQNDSSKGQSSSSNPNGGQSWSNENRNGRNDAPRASGSNQTANRSGGPQNSQKPYTQMTEEQKAAQKEERLRRGECFRCGDKGHLYRNCHGQ
jgi:Retrotransposon gag protein